MYKRYRKRGYTEMRPYEKGEDLTKISISPEDMRLPSLVGGMIARDPRNHLDEWYVSTHYFVKNYERI